MESITRRFQICFLKFLCLVVLSLLLAGAAQAQSRRTRGAETSLPCTTRTGLHCEIYGSGQPILFLHGLGGSTFSWRHMKELSQYYQVILIDFRGEGQSPKPHDNHYSILDQRDLIYQFIVEKNLRRLILVGNSYGGAVSLLLAIKLCAPGSPSRLAKLILIDSAGYPDHLPLFLVVLRTPILGWLAVHLLSPALQILLVLCQSYYDPAKITTDQIEAYAQPLAEPGGRDALLEIGKRAIPKDIQKYIDLYPTISVPTLILWGEHDRVLRRDVGVRLNVAIPDSRLQYIEFAGHIPQEEEPDPVVCRIKAFLMPNVTCPPQHQNPER